MVFDGIYFNDAHISGMTQAQFIKHEKHTLSEEKLKEVYAICKAMHNGNGKKLKGKANEPGRDGGGDKVSE